MPKDDRRTESELRDEKPQEKRDDPPERSSTPTEMEQSPQRTARLQRKGARLPTQPTERLERAGRPERAQPNVDLHDEPTDVTVVVDLPGFEPDQIEVSTSGQRLRLRAERPELASSAEKSRIYTRERPAKLDRSIDLPARVDAEQADAEFENGVLRVTLPKREDEQERSIDIVPPKP